MFEKDYQAYSKADKKAIQELINKGLYNEFETGLAEIEEILKDWRANKKDNKETYHKVYSSLKNFDKHIARRYDSLGGSRFVSTVRIQVVDEVLTEEDLSILSEKGREMLGLE